MALIFASETRSKFFHSHTPIVAQSNQMGIEHVIIYSQTECNLDERQDQKMY